MKVILDIPDDDIRAALETARVEIIMGRLPWAVTLELGPTLKGYVLLANTQQTAQLDIERGLRMMLTHGSRDNETGAALSRSRGEKLPDWDSTQCDAFVQYAAFGKLVYG